VLLYKIIFVRYIYDIFFACHAIISFMQAAILDIFIASKVFPPSMLRAV